MATPGELTAVLGAAAPWPPPAVLDGYSTPAVEERVRRFALNVPEMLERWVSRRESPHTRRAYRQDLAAFIEFLGLSWPADAAALLAVTVGQVHAYRDALIGRGAAPKTVNRRVSSLSGFFTFLREVAAAARLPVQVANPAGKEFVARGAADPVEERRHLSAARARHLLSLPAGESVLDYRDRAMLKVLLYAGVRVGTLLRLDAEDVGAEGDSPTLRVTEKGGRRRTIGLNVLAAEAVREYAERAGIVRGPLFRPRRNAQSRELGGGRMSYATAYRVLRGYLARLPGAVREAEGGGPRCVYTPHSTRATTATLLLEAGEDIRKVQELLGHRHVTTTQIYDRRRRQASDGSSHRVPI